MYRIEDLGIEVRLNTVVDRRVAADFFPDVVIVATGARIVKPSIPGADAENLLNASRLLINQDVFKIGQNIVVLGGGKIGLTVAEVLSKQGKKVAIVESNPRVDFDVSMTFKWRHAALVKELGIQVYTEAEALAVESKAVQIRNKDGQEKSLPADTVILAGPLQPNQNLVRDLEYFCDELYAVGDAMTPRSLYNAIHEGYKIGTRI